MTKNTSLWRANRRTVRHVWGTLPQARLLDLKRLTEQFQLSVAAGEVQFLEGKWYITHAGLMALAARKRCAGICVRQVHQFCDLATSHWVFKATVYKSHGSRGFVGFGDANPKNVSPLVRGSEMRVAETRAVNRALRKAYGIGLCSVDELGYTSSVSERFSKGCSAPITPSPNGSSNGESRLRDRLCLLIRQHRLDPVLVKRFAADFCGTQELREASRELIESFITTLGQQAMKDRDGLICRLNSYRLPREVKS